MPKTLFAPLIVLLFSCSSSRHRYFEGEIDYKITYDLTNPSDTSIYIVDYPASRARVLFKEGSWLRSLDSAKDYAFSYFDRPRNREYWRLRRRDTLIYFPAGERGGAKEDSIESLQILPHADTILGRVCDRLVMRTGGMTLLLSFDPTLPIDPEWFSAAKKNSTSPPCRRQFP